MSTTIDGSDNLSPLDTTAKVPVGNGSGHPYHHTIQQVLDAAAAAAPVTSVAGKTGAVSLAKGDVGLGNVDNTSDANKPVSTAQAAADAAVLSTAAGLYVPKTLAGISYSASLSSSDRLLNWQGGVAQVIAPGDFAPRLFGLGTLETTPASNYRIPYIRTGLGDTGIAAISDILGVAVSDIKGLTLTGNAGKVVTVNSGETHLELDTAPSGATQINQLTDAYNDTNGLNVGFKQQGGGHATGTQNTYLSAATGGFVTSGSQNTVVGYLTAQQLTSGSHNTAIGHTSAQNISSGGGNVALGTGSAPTLTTGGDNTLIGYTADVSDAGASNRTAIGKGAISTADDTVQVGNTSITDVYFGDGTAILHGVLVGGGGGSATFAGLTDIHFVSTGDNSPYLYMDFDSQNYGFGAGCFAAGAIDPAATGNVALGSSCLAGVTTGVGNTAMGSSAGSQVNTGQENTLIGDGCAPNLESGNTNIVIGSIAGQNLDSASNCIVIGNTYTDDATEDGQIIIGPYKFPSTPGTTGQVLTCMDDSGTLSWTTPTI